MPIRVQFPRRRVTLDRSGPACRGFFVPGLILACSLFLAQTACDKDYPSSRTGERLQTLQAENQGLAEDNKALRQVNQDLQDRLELLNAEYENLAIQRDELRRWTRELARACGPSVWKPGVYEYPLPYKLYDAATAEQLLDELNGLLRAKSLPQVRLRQIRDTTAHVGIHGETVLTQQMGTTGAAAYMNAVAYTLCSLKQITCVDFEFRSGDHAVPGRICP